MSPPPPPACTCPRVGASADGRGLTFKKKSATRKREDYGRHVHAIAFRLLGETFVALPRVERVVVSGYTQRIDPATGHEHDDYLFSARVTRQTWQTIDFDHLDRIDPIAALGAFDTRRRMTKTGIFHPIEPWPEASGHRPSATTPVAPAVDDAG